jgi:hypothetical protein
MIGGSARSFFRTKTNEAYDAEFAYRFMEALRNYAQHRGSPLHGTTFSSHRIERDEEQFGLRYAVWASIDVDTLRDDGDFKAEVIAEIGEEKIDALAMCRIYVEKLGEIHAKTRDELQGSVDQAKSLLIGALDRYENETGESRVGVCFCRSESETTVDEFHPIPDDVIELYDTLVRQNRHVVNLRRRFVTNELIPDRKGLRVQ